MDEEMTIEKYTEWYIENSKLPIAPKGEMEKWCKKMDDEYWEINPYMIPRYCEAMFYVENKYQVPNDYWCADCFGGEKPEKGTQFWVPK